MHSGTSHFLLDYLPSSVTALYSFPIQFNTVPVSKPDTRKIRHSFLVLRDRKPGQIQLFRQALLTLYR